MPTDGVTPRASLTAQTIWGFSPAPVVHAERDLVPDIVFVLAVPLRGGRLPRLVYAVERGCESLTVPRGRDVDDRLCGVDCIGDRDGSDGMDDRDVIVTVNVEVKASPSYASS